MAGASRKSGQVIKPAVAGALVAAVISSCNTSVYDRQAKLRHEKLSEQMTEALANYEQLSDRDNQAQNRRIDEITGRICVFRRLSDT